MRRRLRRIRYYSRARQRTVWTRAVEGAMFVTLLLAPPAVLASEAVWASATTVETITGRLFRDEGGGIVATVVEDGDRPWGATAPLGEWSLRAQSLDHGWPFASARQRRPLALDLNLFDEVDDRVDAALAAGDPTRAAVAAALVEAGRADLAGRWGEADDRPVSRRWLATVANAMAWWLLLLVAAVVAIRGLALAALLARARRAEAGAERASRGRCATCDYDLRGLEWAERCPECGALTH